MRYVIIGAGALGTLIAARLAHHDMDVHLVERRPERRDRVQAGVEVTGFYRGPRTTPSVSDWDDLDPRADVLLLCTGPADTERAVAQAAERFTGHPPLVSFVGGVDGVDTVASWPGEHVIAVSNLEVRLDGAGNPETGFHNFTWLGNLSATETDAMRLVQRDLAWIGPILTTKVIHGMVWSKAIYLIEAALPGIVGQAPIDFYGVARHREAAAEIVREGISIARAHGVTPIAFDFFDPNLYGASTPGERGTLDAWMHHAWQRHEQFRVGAPVSFTEPAGAGWSLDPRNPTQELGGLLADLRRRGAEANVATPRLDALAAIAERVGSGGPVATEDVVGAALASERA